MATYNKGILGAFSGKVGPVVWANWRGKDVMRSLPKKSKRRASAIQMQQRQKFGMVSELLNGLQPVIKRYYGSDGGLKTRRNQLMSYLLKEALLYNDPDFEWNFTKVLVSRGDLLGINAGSVSAVSGGILDFEWTDNSAQGEAEATDKLVVVVYEPTSKTTVYSLNAGSRDAEAAALALPDYLTGLAVHVWVLFAAVDDKRFATSTYLGTTTVI